MVCAVALPLLMLCAAESRPLSAQGDTAATEEQLPQGAAVVFRGDTLFRIISTLGPFTPAERAKALERRIDSLANDALARARDIAVVDSSGVTDVRLGDFIVMSVTERDAVEAGASRSELAERFAERIRGAIRGRQTAASLRSILIGLLFTLLATAALVLAFRAMNWLFPVIYRTLNAWRGTRIPAIRIQRLEVLSASRLTDALIVIAKAGRIASVVVVLYVFVPLVLGFFPWTRRFSSTLVSYVMAPLQRAGSEFINFLPDLVTIAVIVVMVWYALRFIQLFFGGVERGAIALPGFYREWAQPTYKIVRFLVIAFAFVVIWPYLPGSDTPAFRGVSVFLGLLVSFGSASAIANVVAGVVMTYMRPFSVGDRVKIADTVGDITEKTLLVTRVRTIKNVDITIPNSMVLSSHIINYSSTSKTGGGVILHTGVTIGYDAPWRKVHELLLSAAVVTEGLLEEPKPFVLQTRLDDFYVHYELNAYTENPNAMARIYSDLHQNIQDKFNEGGVEIMSPHYAALRDGNTATIPPNYLPPSYRTPAFNVQSVGEAIKRTVRSAADGS
jgi:small-conductance mechanosensitive channel